jgi:cell wall-associated NlpC family hydrolase
MGLKKQMMTGALALLLAVQMASANLTTVASMVVVAPQAKFHAVTKGDNDYSIAKKYGLKVDQLHKLNPTVDWTKLQIGQKIKVAAASAPKPVPKAQAVGTKVSGKTAEITKTDVIVRKGPGTDYDRVALVDKGQKADVLESKSGWYKIKFSSGTTGWVRADMLKISAKTASKPVVAKKPESKPVAKAPSKPAEKPASEPAKLPETPTTGQSTPLITNVTEEIIVEPLMVVEAPVAVATPVQNTVTKIEITGDKVNIRKEPSTKASKVVTVTRGRVAEVLGRKDEWFKIRFTHGTIGWVHRDFVKFTQSDAVDRVVAAPAAPQATPKAIPLGKADGLISTAKDQLGVRYSWGGTSRSGFDCSGFVQYVFAKHGVKLPRTALSQSGVGQKVARADLQAGDLVFFITRGSRVSHVGIYVDSGKFIHASSGGGRVRIDALSTSYYAKRYAGARRVGKFTPSIADEIKREFEDPESGE